MKHWLNSIAECCILTGEMRGGVYCVDLSTINLDFL